MLYRRTLLLIHPILENSHLLTKLVMFVLSRFSRVQLFAILWTIAWIPQARILEWVAMPASRGDLPDPGIELSSLTSPPSAGGFFTTSATWKVVMRIKVLQLER